MRIFILIFCLAAAPAFAYAIPQAPDDATDAIQALLDQGVVAQIPAGTFLLSKTIRIPNGGSLQGAGKGRTILKLKAGVNDDMIRTVGFEKLAGSAAIGRAPANFSIAGLTLDGNYLENHWSANKNKVNNSKGSCLKLYGKRFEIDAEVNNCAEHGLYSEGQGPRNGVEVASTIRITGTVFGKEALVFRGPGDIMIEHAVLGLAGILPKSTQLGALPKSSLYPDYGMVDGVVIDKTAPYQGTVEVGFLHTYATWNGFGFRTRGNPRLLAQHLISESNLGGVAISRNTWGGIGILDVHSNGKHVPGFLGKPPAPMEGVLSATQGPFFIAGGIVHRTVGSGEGWPAIRVTGGNQMLSLAIHGNVNPATGNLYRGDGVILEGSGNIVNVVSARSNGRFVLASGNGNQVKAVIDDSASDCRLSGVGNQFDITGGNKSCRTLRIEQMVR